MVPCKLVTIAYIVISSLTKISLVQCQANGGFIDYGSYFVPYSQKKSGCVQYLSAQNSPVDNGPYLTNQPYVPNVPLPPPPPIYSNNPAISYQGFEEANALRQAYPNQPIIIINNGGNGDSGGNSDNGKNGIDFGELAAIFLAAKAGKKRGGAGGGESPEPAEPPAAVTAPSAQLPVSYPYIQPPAPPTATIPHVNNNSDGSSGGNNKTNINITIILPNSSASVTVEEKNQKRKNSAKRKKKPKVVEEEEEDEALDDCEDNSD